MKSMVEYVHERLSSYGQCKIGIDMTMGNGNDTLALCYICEEVYSFDVQQAAIDATYKKVQDYNHVHLILDNHQNVDSYVQECDIAVFNLGYLPQFSHEITTILESTQCALKKIIKMMNKAVFIVVYPGHSEGYRESLWIDEFVSTLNSKHFNVSQYRMLNKNKAPYVIEIEKRKHIV